MDIRLWSKELITDFINLYKANPCLWKVKCEEYKNRNLREEAYNNIIDFLKLRGFPEANRDFVFKKIQSLRGSFRKELKKSRQSQLSGGEDIYTSSLWYYDLLLFTKDQEAPTESISNIDDSISQDVESDIKIEDEEVSDIEQSNYSSSTLEPQIRDIASMPKPMIKRKRESFGKEFLEMYSQTLAKENVQGIDEFDAIGINVSKKLSKMEPLQAVHAEYLISGILRAGLLEKLTEETDFCKGRCKFLKSDTPSSSK